MRSIRVMCGKILCTFGIMVLFSCASAHADVSSHASVIPDQATLPILNPAFNRRTTLKLHLSNGLEAYLVSDPSLEKSGAMLSVKVGSWEDPEEHSGIAHFLEHMLFLGTRKYPKESEYQSFIAENGGATNAFTSHGATSYFFSVNATGFEEALDRFADFFKEPLFNPSGVERELQAVDQEYSMHLENDAMRLLYVDKIFANPQHPYHHFHIGNRISLSKVSRERLIEWYQSHYSADRMRLTVYSVLPMEQLRQLVEDDFKEIPRTDAQVEQVFIPLFAESSTPSIVYIEPIKQVRALTILWEMPEAVVKMKESRPADLLCYILGHEGEESLLAELKRSGLAEGLDCGVVPLNQTQAEFMLQVSLTDEGVSAVDTVIERCFQALLNVKQKGVPRYLFEEIQQMDKIRYQYQPREDLFSTLMDDAQSIFNEDLATYPEQGKVVQKYRAEDVQTLLALMTPQAAHYYVMAPFSITGFRGSEREPWMGADYVIKPFDRALLQQLENLTVNPKIRLPLPNRFIPKQLSVLQEEPTLPEEDVNLLPHPETILDNDAGKIYYSADHRYRMPEVNWRFYIKTLEIEMGSAFKSVMADLYVKTVEDLLKPVSYPAKLAGLEYEISTGKFGLQISIKGFSENASLFLEEILKILGSVSLTEQQFQLYKESLRRTYKSFAKESPISQAGEYFNSLIFKRFTTEKQKALAINRVTLNAFNEYAKKIFARTYVEGLFYGNQSRQEAMGMTDKLMTALESAPSLKAKQQEPQVILLSGQSHPLYWEVGTQAQGNAVILAIEGPPFSFKERAVQHILMQAIRPLFFATLRTKQQTGYIVYSEGKELRRQLFNLFAVQSNTHTVRDLLSRFELFIEGFIQELPREISEGKFKQLKTTALASLQQTPKTIAEIGDLLFLFGFEYNGDFDWLDKRIQGIQSLAYSEFLDSTYEWLGKKNKKRIAILLKGVIPEEESLAYKPVGSLLNMRKTNEYTQDAEVI